MIPSHLRAVLPRRYVLGGGSPATGGFGRVYRATDSFLDREVAIKVVSAPTTTNFERELAALHTIQSKYVVDVYDAIRDPGTGELVAIVLEYLEGPDLEDAFPAGAPTPSDEMLMRLLWQTASGLAAIHAAGHVHHDLKPQNVRYDAFGLARICDFGLARHGQSGTVNGFGTRGYASPELFQAAPRQIHPEVDVWAFGATAHRLGTGALPLQLQNVPPGVPGPFHVVRSTVPAVVCSAVDSCFHPSGSRPTAVELQSAFGRALLRDRHRALVCFENRHWTVDSTTPRCALKVGDTCRLRIEYDGFFFVLTVITGTIRVNNRAIPSPFTLPDACVMSVDGQSAHLSFAVSHPENVL